MEKVIHGLSAKALWYACGGIFLFSVVTALVKLLTDDYPVFLVSFYRNFFALLPAAGLLLATRRMDLGSVRQWKIHLLRAFFGFGSMVCLFQAFHLIPLAEATIVYYTGPLFITVLAALVLKEVVHRGTWLAVGLGLAGVALILRPEQPVFNTGLAYALAGTVFYALAMVSLRQLGKSEDPLMMAFIFALIATVLNAAFLPFVWAVPTLPHFLLLAATGVIAFIAQTMMNTAYVHANASALSPLIYTSLIWNAMFGFLIWGDIPGLAALAGMVIVLAANILNKKSS